MVSRVCSGHVHARARGQRYRAVGGALLIAAVVPGPGSVTRAANAQKGNTIVHTIKIYRTKILPWSADRHDGFDEKRPRFLTPYYGGEDCTQDFFESSYSGINANEHINFNKSLEDYVREDAKNNNIAFTTYKTRLAGADFTKSYSPASPGANWDVWFDDSVTRGNSPYTCAFNFEVTYQGVRNAATLAAKPPAKPPVSAPAKPAAPAVAGTTPPSRVLQAVNGELIAPGTPAKPVKPAPSPAPAQSFHTPKIPPVGTRVWHYDDQIGWQKDEATAMSRIPGLIAGDNTCSSAEYGDYWRKATKSLETVSCRPAMPGVPMVTCRFTVKCVQTGPGITQNPGKGGAAKQ